MELIVFDIDGTLAELNNSIPNSVLEEILLLTKAGIKICLSSGKPAAYIAGLCRQSNLNNVIIIGENGTNIYMTSTFPPEKEITLYNRDIKNTMTQFKENIDFKLTDIVWYQPNIINLTCFYKDRSNDSYVDDIIYSEHEKNKCKEDLLIFKHEDSIELVHKDLNKGNALRRLLKELNIDPQKTVAVGDSSNDIPMFKVAGVSIGINISHYDGLNYDCRNITEVLNIINKDLL